MPRPRHVIGVAASAGGVEALCELVAGLPRDLDAALCVVLHIPPEGRSLLAPILARAGVLDAVVAEHGLPLRAGTVYVAPADSHLLVQDDRVELDDGPREHGTRPAADPMLRSLAASWREQAIAVVLSGSLADGAAGALEVERRGGRVFVQDPAEALVSSMPEHALEASGAPEVATVAAIAARLSGLCSPAGRREASDRAATIDPMLHRGAGIDG